VSQTIKRVAVIGAGTMGGGIAAVVANAGLAVYLLDVAPTELTIEEQRAGLTLEDRPVRNRIVEALFDRLKKRQPAAFLTPETADLVTIGNLEDDFDWIADADWIVEAVVEQLEPKRALMARIESKRKPGSIISSNTSGLPIASIGDEASEDFKQHLLGTHFFNPPRYMKLLEIIPTQHTNAEVIRTISDFATEKLGKGVVICKDTPNFIANRYGSITSAIALEYILRNGYTVEEADAIMGPLIGRPKTGIFRLQDLVGLDVSYGVGANLYPLIPDDESREILRDPQLSALRQAQMDRGRLGDKTGQGFYRKPLNGNKEDILSLDLGTMEYRPRQTPDLPSIAEALKIESLGDRLAFVLAQNDRVGKLARHVVYNALAYAARRVPEITDRIVNIDRAIRWGYSHELGPFEIWDLLGVRSTVSEMEANGIKVAPWVKEMLARGCESFYRNEKGVLSYYDSERKEYVSEKRRELSGLEYMQKLVAGEIPVSGMSELIGFRLSEVSEGHAVIVITPGEQHYNGLGIVHGGLAATLLDSALGVAINTMMPPGKVFTTVEMKVNYIRPIRGETGQVRCIANVVHVGGRVATAEGRIVDENGKLYAHGTATCMLFRQL
jgi:3-hydroxyacyl-CoA dehydrogenase